jgi:guanyl-specific ribonuclease Sa
MGQGQVHLNMLTAHNMARVPGRVWSRLIATCLAAAAASGCRAASAKRDQAPTLVSALVSASGVASALSASPTPQPSAAGRTPQLDLKSSGNAARDAQIGIVVAAMDATGHPPTGVTQGGHPPGAFRNREGRLPRGVSYIESDIWPQRAHGGRGSERLIFGGKPDIWLTLDHYESFEKIR